MGTALLLASRMRPVIAAAEELSWAAVQPDRTAKSRAQTQRCRDRGYRAYRRKPRRAMRMQRRTFVPLVNGSRLRIRFLPGHSSESRIATARGLASAAAGDAQYRRMANWSARTSPRQPTPGMVRCIVSTPVARRAGPRQATTNRVGGVDGLPALGRYGFQTFSCFKTCEELPSKPSARKPSLLTYTCRARKSSVKLWPERSRDRRLPFFQRQNWRVR